MGEKPQQDLKYLQSSFGDTLGVNERGTSTKRYFENWYNIHIWSIIDSSYNDPEGLEVVRGEGVSLASSKRKNSKRTIEDVNSKARKLMGHRFDFLIQSSNPHSTNNFEFGAAEFGKEYEFNGSKAIKEGGEKLPKVLKDMLDLLKEKTNNADINTIGIVHSGLHLKVIIADRPKGYITRITAYNELRVPTDIKSFGEEVLPVLAQIYEVKMQVKKNSELIKNGTSSRAPGWLDSRLKKLPPLILPTTSTSSETPRKK